MLNKQISALGTGYRWLSAGCRQLMLGMCLLLLYISVRPALAIDLPQITLGPIASYSPDVYHGSDREVNPFLMIGYESKYVFVRGLSAGVRLRPLASAQNIIFRVRYDNRTFKPQDSDDARMRLLDERKETVLAGASYQLRLPFGLFDIGGGTDIGDHHNGLYAEATLLVPLGWQRWRVSPQIGYTYNSDRINNYYYGVSKAEAARSGLKAFDADWDGQYFIGVSGTYSLQPNLLIMASVRYSNLDHDLEQSPMLRRTVMTSGYVGVAYRF
ncbi:outer membrane protein [Vibrio xiamenensis]|uniref:Outer membrane protein n=1 Tax=Vibrio xiamenensis TaxID=861298 RepID=A0A1G8GEL0_9VIBR|nr:MipA/OmpV family protein [Vibrio xiamenensis]SDH92770.1 outer membrane protein [Vibrio xiamenensis]